jgi:hypothetical protein
LLSSVQPPGWIGWIALMLSSPAFRGTSSLVIISGK